MEEEGLIKKIFSLIDKNKQPLTEFIINTLKIPSENHNIGGDEEEVQNFLYLYFKKMDLEVDKFLPTDVKDIEKHPGWWPGDKYEKRPNVVASWRGTGKGKSLIINGHIDTVEAGPLDLWNSPPYSPVIKNGILYARGAVDMKGSMAAIAALIGLLKNNGFEIDGNLIYESVVGEEFGWFNGSLSCILKKYEADAAIIPEPTNMRIALGTKGTIDYRLKVLGKGTHQSLWWKGVSALDNFIKIKNILKKFQEIRELELKDHPLYGQRTDYPLPALSDDVYYLNVGSPNLMAVPIEAVADFMVDVLPGEDREYVLKKFENFVLEESYKDDFLKENKIELIIQHFRPIFPTSVPDDLEIVKLIELAFKNVTGKTASLYGFESSCDAMMFNLHSKIPAIIFGPGDLEEAHRPNENINIEDLFNYIKVIAFIINSFCGLKIN